MNAVTLDPAQLATLADLVAERLAERMQPKVESPRIDREELAEMLHCSLRTIDRRVTAGEIPRPDSIGRQVSWSRDEINRWLAAGMPKRKAWEIIRRS